MESGGDKCVAGGDDSDAMNGKDSAQKTMNGEKKMMERTVA